MQNKLRRTIAAMIAALFVFTFLPTLAPATQTYLQEKSEPCDALPRAAEGYAFVLEGEEDGSESSRSEPEKPEGGISKAQEPTRDPADYTYEVMPILAPFPYYIYVKTENPDPESFQLVDRSSQYFDDDDQGEICLPPDSNGTYYSRYTDPGTYYI